MKSRFREDAVELFALSASLDPMDGCCLSFDIGNIYMF